MKEICEVKSKDCRNRKSHRRSGCDDVTMALIIPRKVQITCRQAELHRTPISGVGGIHSVLEGPRNVTLETAHTHSRVVSVARLRLVHEAIWGGVDQDE